MQGPRRIPEISNDDLKRFHAAKRVNAACPYCGTSTWDVLTGGVPALGLPTATDEEKANVDLFVPVHALSCGNCGNIWLINHLLLEQWLAENPGSKEG
jgi:hypothetical protein